MVPYLFRVGEGLTPSLDDQTIVNVFPGGGGVGNPTCRVDWAFRTTMGEEDQVVGSKVDPFGNTQGAPTFFMGVGEAGYIKGSLAVVGAQVVVISHSREGHGEKFFKGGIEAVEAHTSAKIQGLQPKGRAPEGDQKGAN